MEFKNMALRGIYGPNRDEIIGGWGKLNNEEIVTCNLRQL
jgi:hypothetical protein